MASNMFEGTGGPVNTTTSGTDPLTDVAELWMRERKSKAEELKENHEGDWIRYWRWFLNWAKPLTEPMDWWRSNAPDPEAFKIIATRVPKQILGMWMSQEPYTIRGRERSDAPYEAMVKGLLDYGIDAMDLFPKLAECMTYVGFMGHAWGKVTWRMETEDEVRDLGEPVLDETSGRIVSFRGFRQTTKRTVYNDPWFEWLMLDKVWADPTGKGRWYIEEIETTLEELEETNEEHGGALYKNLGTLAASGSRTGTGEPFSEQADGMGIDDSHTLATDGTRVTLHQCWGWVPKELRGPDGAAWRLTVIGNGLVEIRDVPIPTPNNRPPYFPIKSVIVPGRLYGESILRWIGPKIDQKSDLANMRMDEVKLGVWQQYIYDRDAVTNNQMLFQPGGAIPVEMGGTGDDIRKKFAVLDRRPILSEAYVEDQHLKQVVEDAAAATPLQQGVADTSRQTATEINRLSSQGDQRFVLDAMLNDSMVKKQILERMFKWYQKRLPPGRQIRILGEDGRVQGEQPVFIQDIQMPVDIIVESGLESFNREARIQSAQEYVQLAASEAFAPYIKVGALLTQLSRDRGHTDPGRFVKTEQEVQQAQQAALQQQMQMAMAEKQMEVQAQLAIEQAKNQGTLALEQGKFQIMMAEAQLDMAIKQREAELEQIEQTMKLEGTRAELVARREEIALELEFLRAKQALQLEGIKAQNAAKAAAARSGNSDSQSSRPN